MTFLQFELAAASILTVLGWLTARIIAGSKPGRLAALIIDLMIPLAALAVALALTARPLFSGVIVCGLCCTFAFADWKKRRTLTEPIVFHDFVAASDILRNPQVCLVFGNLTLLAAAVIITVSLLATIFVFESPAWEWSPLPPLLAIAVVCLVVSLARGPGLVRIGELCRTLKPVGSPIEDARKLGPFAMQLVYGFIAVTERPARQLQVMVAPNAEKSPTVSQPERPVILVQSESFFDVRRLSAQFPPHVLEWFSACCEGSVRWGRLATPGWGANSVRTEFAVLTGIPDELLGFDRFNPYYGFARKPIRSIAWDMRAAGYRTICVHPFERSFYRRDRVMTNLGFDLFIGGEAFVGAKRNGKFVADEAVSDTIKEIMRQNRGKVFIFAITMENHGPWNEKPDASAAADVLPRSREWRAYESYLKGIQSADGMIRSLMDGLLEDGRAGLLALYGDHLPALPEVFDELKFVERESDYVIWRADNDRPSQRQDLLAQNLGDAILRACVG